jgi:predicted outer membrane repeat protein
MACAATANGGTVLFVDDDAAPGGDGMSWDSAYRFLQVALSIAHDPDNGVTEIRVGQGVYCPDRDEADPQGTGDRAATFALVAGVALEGGYAGIGAPNPDARDVALYETVLSGDLLGDDGPDFANSAENSLHVVMAHQVGDTAVLDGFTVSGGRADGPGADAAGAGLYIDADVSATITDCAFVNNAADHPSAYGGAGAGVYSGGGNDLTFTDCAFSGNAAEGGGGGLFSGEDSIAVLSGCSFEGNTAYEGSGVFSYESDTTFDGCTFTGNASANWGLWGGGTVHNYLGSATLTSCTFTGNTSNGEGGAIYAYLGYGSLTLVDCVVEGNATRAGAAVSGGSAIVIGCTFTDNTTPGSGAALDAHGATVIGCTFNGNTAADRGGAVRLRSDSVYVDCLFAENATGPHGGAMAGLEISNVTLVGCTLTDNSADFGGALYLNEAEVTLAGCALIGNTADEWGGGIYGAFADAVYGSCLFSGNSAGGTGGALHNFRSSPLLANCTFFSNAAGTDGGGIYNQLEANPNLVNCILWQNTDSGPPDESAQLFHFSESQSVVNYSCVQGWTGDLGGVGNFDDDPQFVDPVGPDGIPGTPDDDLRILSGSPCIDAGDGAGLSLCATDLDGNGRFADDPATPDSGPGTPPIVDLGAYELGGLPANDCNGNTLGDDCELAEGITPDCNDNDLPDDCDLFAGTSPDCNDNDVPDECDIADGFSTDCNENGRPDECDLADGILPDCNGNDIADLCEILHGTSPDCNGNGIPDECDLVAGTSPDCNDNGVPDECDIAEETSPDCNDNDIPDECDIVGDIAVESGPLSPIGTGFPQAWVWPAPPAAVGDTVTFTFTAVADLWSPNEVIDIDLNGVPIGTAFSGGGNADCPIHPQSDQLTVTGETFNTILDDSGPDLTVNMVASIVVNPFECDGTSWISVAVEYVGVDPDVDGDGNGVPDECEPPGDINGDGLVDVTDFLMLLARWGPCPVPPEPCPADLDGDAIVGVNDFLILLANWS